MYFIFCLFSVSISSNTYGQIAKFEYGIQSGININSANGNSIDKSHRKLTTGIAVGGHIRMKISDKVGIKLSVQYDQNGWSYHSLAFEDNTGTTLGTGDAIFKLNYLNIPVVTELSFGKKIRYRTNGGIFFGYLLSNQTIIKIKEPAPPNIASTTSSSSEYRSTNFGLSFGIGMQIPVTHKLKLDLDMQDNIGLVNIDKAGGDIKTNTILISAGLSVPL